MSGWRAVTLAKYWHCGPALKPGREVRAACASQLMVATAGPACCADLDMWKTLQNWNGDFDG